MVKLWTSEHVFDHPWAHVTAGHWTKYPNPFNPAVEAIDVLHRQVTPSGELHSTRLMSTRFNLPKWAKKIIGVDRVHAVEHSQVDPAARELHIRSRNLSYNDTLCIEETIVYREHPTDPSKTLMQHTAEVTVPSMSFAEKPLRDNFAKNAHKGRDGMNWAIERLPEDFKDRLPSPTFSRKPMHA